MTSAFINVYRWFEGDSRKLAAGVNLPAARVILRNRVGTTSLVFIPGRKF